MRALGTHWILDLYGCPSDLLNDPVALEQALREAAASAGAQWLGHLVHRFEPQGVTAIGLLAESHIAVHTWPELGYAGADIFTCGERVRPRLACSFLERALSPIRVTRRRVSRGEALQTIAETLADPILEHEAP